MKRNVAILKDCPDCDREFLPAARAFPNAFADVALSIRSRLQAVGFVHKSTMRTHRAFWPTLLFKEFARLVFVSEVLGKID